MHACSEPLPQPADRPRDRDVQRPPAHVGVGVRFDHRASPARRSPRSASGRSARASTRSPRRAAASSRSATATSRRRSSAWPAWSKTSSRPT